MLIRFIIIFVGLLSTSTFAKTIELVVSGIEVNRGGQVMVLVFKEDNFPIKHESSVLQLTRNQLADSLTFSFELDVPVFAVKVLHDENSDSKVTKNWLGIYPKEGLGFSNNQVMTLTGPPSFAKSKLTLAEVNSPMQINLIYP